MPRSDLRINDEILIYRLLARALLEIRIGSVEGASKLVFEMADIFHNVPYQLELARSSTGDFSSVINWLRMRCEQKGVLPWLESAIADIVAHQDQEDNNQ